MPFPVIESYFKGKISAKLMTRLFLNPLNTVYLRGLEKEFGVSSNTVRVELNKLSAVQLIEVVDNPEFDLEPTISFSELVNQQDISVCVRVQRGVASSSFSNAFHTKMERYCKQLIRRYRAEVS